MSANPAAANPIEDRMLALAGLAQALKQVRQIAETGQADTAVLQTATDSVFRLDADTPLQVYGHGHALAKGMDMKLMDAEFEFKATGMNGGYAGEMHVADPSIGHMGADGMIGPGPVIATGSALAIKARGSKQVVVNFGGDGTYATPHFHAVLNNAALLKLPFIYVLVTGFTEWNATSGTKSIIPRTCVA